MKQSYEKSSTGQVKQSLWVTKVEGEVHCGQGCGMVPGIGEGPSGSRGVDVLAPSPGVGFQ